jgi:hypothetical protein
VSAKFVELATPPPVPVTATVEFPMYVDWLYAEVSVIVALPDVVIDEGEKLAATPVGSP